MSMTIVSVYLKSESSDGYLFTYDQVANVDEFVELVEKDLGEELAYCYVENINVLYSNDDAGAWERTLTNRISEMGYE